MSTNNIFILVSLLSLSFSIYPIAVFHGIVDNCEMKNTSQLVNDLRRDLDVHVECIEIGNGYMDTIFKNLQAQVEEACEKIKSNPNFQSKFSILGISQGTLIGRYVIEKCNMLGQVMRHMSFDGPQMGIGSVPKLTCGAFCDFLVNITSPIFYGLQDRIAPAAYYRYKYDQEYYRQHNKFLKMLNNENEEKDEEIYKRFSSLEKVKLIRSKDDSVIVPKESSWFMFYDESGKNIVPLEESEFYKKDFIGLKKLNEEGKLSFAEFRDEHVIYNVVEYWEEIVPFFED
jgi:palmitoyl-protein thioesterase